MAVSLEDSTIKVLLGVITVLLSIIAFFMQDLWRRVRKWEKNGVIKEFCDRVHTDVTKYLHQHGKDGSAGEVVSKL